MTPDEQRSSWVAGLRKMADLVESCPVVRPGYYFSAYHSVDNRDEMRRIAKAIGGMWKKHSTETDFQLEQDLGGGVRYVIYASHENVCQRKVVGQKEKTIQMPVNGERALELQNELMNLETKSEVVQEDIVEWDCPGILD